MSGIFTECIHYTYHYRILRTYLLCWPVLCSLSFVPCISVYLTCSSYTSYTSVIQFGHKPQNKAWLVKSKPGKTWETVPTSPESFKTWECCFWRSSLPQGCEEFSKKLVLTSIICPGLYLYLKTQKTNSGFLRLI